ncbi:CATRA conflict system CASPASE/TPR repeat-associated protein [Actinophytocola sediminis]
MTPPTISRPALLVYAFAALDGGPELASAGWARLADLWRACRTIGPSTAPLLGVSAPEYLPDRPAGTGPFRIVASGSRATPGRTRSMFVFTEHGIAGLVAAISADRDGVDGFAELVADWRSVDPAGGALIGKVTVLLGLAATATALPEVAAGLATGYGARVDLPTADHGPAGALLWNLDESDRARVLVLAAEESAESAVDEWAWAVDGRQGLTPLTRYCLTVFRADHQRQLYESLRPLSELVTETDTAVTALAAHLVTADQPATELIAADQRLQRVRLGATGVLWRLSKVREMATGVHALRVNLRRHRPESTVPGAMFDHDDTALTWLADQLDREASYLDGLVQRTEAVHATATAVIGAETARRRDRLTLLQTSFIGALLMALAAIQSFQYTTTITAPLKAPVICALAAAACCLPLLVARWSRLVPRTEPYRWSELAAAALFGGALGWLGSGLLWQATAATIAPPLATTLAVLAGALALFVPTWLTRRRAPRG